MPKMKWIYLIPPIFLGAAALILYSPEIDQKQKMTKLTAEDNINAIALYKEENGFLPNDLSEALKYGLNEFDAWGQKFRYRRCGKSDFAIYSVGQNGMDDQGDKDDILMSSSTKITCLNK